MKNLIFGLAIGLSFVPAAVYASVSTASLDARLTALEARVAVLENAGKPVPDPSLTTKQITQLTARRTAILGNSVLTDQLVSELVSIDKKLGTHSSGCHYTSNNRFSLSCGDLD